MLTIGVAGRPIDLLVTHLDAFVVAEREAQAAHLMRRFVRAGRTTILLGDVNAVPIDMTGGRRFFAHDRTHAILTSGSLFDARGWYATLHGVASLAAWATFPAAHPLWPLDAVLASQDLAPMRVDVIGDTASDHRGLAVQYELTDASAGA
jgi:endonuclease/exonuclease/phosphatase family metal-dependent hydrolase